MSIETASTRGKSGGARATSSRRSQIARAIEHATQDRQSHTFDKQLTNKPASTGSESRAHGQITPSRGSSRENERCNVRTRDQERQQHGSENDPQRHSGIVTSDMLLQWHKVRREARKIRIGSQSRVLFCQLVADDVHFPTRLLERTLCAEAPDDEDARLGVAERDPQLDLSTWPLEPCGQYADHLGRVTIQ